LAKPEWGTKRVCQSCGARFYDLARSPIVCPSCGAVFDLELLNRARRARPTPRAAVAVAEDEELVGDDAEIGGDVDVDEDETEAEEDEAAIESDDAQEEDDSLIEDASELGEDEDVSDVIEGGIDEEEHR
jgi:uncharacterized protein (TIGR02300 family)